MLDIDEEIPEGNGTAPCGGTWVSQGDAAARTGFSVSAIRKWRRLGVVADRKMTGPGGIERVEVRLEDVLARVALQPDRPRPEPPPAAVEARSGAVLITIEDLESLFERMVSAERRAEKAEAEVESLERRARYTSGQLAELRRQMEAAGSQAVVAPPPVPRPALPPVPPPPPRPAPPPALPPVPPPFPARVEPVDRAEPLRPPVTNGHRDEEPGSRLRQIYLRLDEYRRHAVITPETEVERQRLLNEYDGELIAVCRALGIPSDPASGPPLTVGARAGLTRALAQAGVDVRAGVRDSNDQRVRRLRPGRRS